MAGSFLSSNSLVFSVTQDYRKVAFVLLPGFALNSSMMSTCDQGLNLRSTTPFTAMKTRRTSSTFITNALGNITIGSDCDSQSASQEPMSQDQNIKMASFPRLSIDITKPCLSQEPLGTPDYSTPQDQQFHVDYDISTQQDTMDSRSPAQSPQRSKRPRHSEGGEEVTSQPSQTCSFTRSQPEASVSNTCCTSSLPPLPRGKSRFSRMSSNDPVTFHNPFYEEAGPDQLHQFDSRLNKTYLSTGRLNCDFKVVREIGNGNFSKVHLAVHRLDGTEYAIKRTRSVVNDDQGRNRWLQEVQALAAVQSHPNIVHYYTCWAEQDVHGEHFYIQLELCEKSLQDVFSGNNTPMKETELVDILKQLASALHHIHSRGLVHLDIKPDNIYVGKDGKYKIGDFGLATMKHGHWRVQEGDARYCPQELLNNNYHHLEKADVFALGATLYELASGSPLPSGGTTYHKIRQGKLVLLPMFSEAFQKMLRSLMAEDPKERPSCEQILHSSLIRRHPVTVTTAARQT